MIPQRLGKFEIISYLGGGRFGDVYLAKDTVIKEKIALKVARSRVLDTSSFLQEIKVLFTLHHPHILRYHSADIIDGKLVLITEYVEGQTLRNYIERRCPTSFLMAEQILLPIADSVDYAHSKFVTHRDLKPENIMLTKDENVKLMDFGLAKFIDRDLSQSVGGTPPYMSPESWRGRVHKASDQWSLAVIAVELLTGINPFFSENLEDIRAKILQTQNPKDYLFFKVPPTTVDAFDRAFSTDPEDRFDTCKEFVEKAFKYLGVPKKKTKKKTQDSVILPRVVHTSIQPTKIFSLTQEQRKALNSKNKKVLLLGGPGTGKTQTLVAKVYDLVFRKNINPINIFITSFTVRSWQDIEARLQKPLRTKAKDLWIGNFHRHCYAILYMHAERIGYQEGFEVIPPSISLQLLRELEKETDFEGYIPASELKVMISRLKLKKIRPENLKASNNQEAYIKHMWQKHQAQLLEKNQMDKDDVLVKTLQLLKTYPDILRGYQNLYKYILVDDLQDFVLDDLFIETINLIMGDRNHLFCTGDDDQNIYGWKNNGRHSETKLDESFEGFAVYNLTKTFRLPHEIQNPALNLISNNENRIEKVLWTRKKPKEGIFEIKNFLTPFDEAVFAGRTIKNSVAFKRSKWKDYAVLCRTRRYLKIYNEVFVKMSIPFSLVENESFFEKDNIHLLIRYLNVISNLKAKEDLNFVMIYSSQPKEEIIRFLEDLHNRKNSISTLAALKLGIEKLSLNHNNDSNQGDGSPLIMDDDVASFLEIVEDFESMSSDKTPEAFLRYLRIYKDSGLKREEEAVKLLTIHQAKGLEFPVVFIGGLVEGEFPRISPFSPEASLAEERRICYVGMTRATNKLYMTYSKYRNLNKSQINRPSRFLKEMIGVQ